MKKKKSKNIYQDKVVNPLKYYLIPHEGNDHKPLLLRPTALKIYLIILILTKLFVTSFLFVSYPSEGYFASVTTGSIINLTNSSRKANKLSELKTSKTLNQAASQKAQDMLTNNYFSHTSPLGTRFWDWIKKAGYRYTTAGENLAMDFTSAKTVHDALMASASHKKNILNPEFKEIGVSILSGKINGRDTMILVEFFGTPKVTYAVAPAPSSPTIPPVTPSQSTPSPYYSAEVVGLSNSSLNLKTGEKIAFWVEIKNTGNTTWYSLGDNFIALNTTDPSGRTSLFKDDSWIEAYRPTTLGKEKVLPGETVRFEFNLQTKANEGEYQEAFQLVAENLSWIEGSYFVIPIKVIAPAIALPNYQNQNINANVNKEVNIIAVTNTNQLLPKEEVKPMSAGTQDVKQTKNLVDYILIYSDWIFWSLLIFVSIALVLNIFIKIRIQHLSIIIPSIMVIILAILMIVTRLHFIQYLVSKPIIL